MPMRRYCPTAGRTTKGVSNGEKVQQSAALHADGTRSFRVYLGSVETDNVLDVPNPFEKCTDFFSHHFSVFTFFFLRPLCFKIFLFVRKKSTRPRVTTNDVQTPTSFEVKYPGLISDSKLTYGTPI